jgi:hypothetical protein
MTVNDKVEMMWKVVVQHLPGKTEDTHGKPVSGQCVKLDSNLIYRVIQSPSTTVKETVRDIIWSRNFK